ncbi:hypothetical protein [Pontibacter pamirensis]|uniref:hypothetical protein n=1 Tax=Pontibacter pamirensis TaxID=2562824 RepID=UPI001389D1CB|nr:hypothetical protein [Pontibacter pamirensis]
MNDTSIIISLAAVAVLACIHILSGIFRVFDGIPRNPLLSFSGGFLVAFVILVLLPGLGKGEEILMEKVDSRGFFSYLPHPVYLILFVSLCFFYWTEQVAQKALEEREQRPDVHFKVFWLPTLTFAILNCIIGFLLLAKMETGLSALLMFVIAMVLQFILNDNNLYTKQKEFYNNKGRWILVMAALIGWGVGAFGSFSDAIPAISQSFLAGTSLLTVFEKELPEVQKSNYLAFVLGGVCYVISLLIINWQSPKSFGDN